VSDGLGLAALSAALRFRIDQAIRAYDPAQIGTFDVVTRPPEVLSDGDRPSSTTLTIYPYHLTPATSWRQMREPAYSSKGARKQDPWLALNVHYVLAVYGPDPGHELALGVALLAMHETKQLTKAMLEDTADNGGFTGQSPLPQALRDLAAQPAKLEISPVHHPVEDISQVWSMMNAGLRTGMLYQVSTLLMERKLPRSSAPPVAEGRLDVHQLMVPRVLRLRFSPSAPPAAQWSDQAVASPGDAIEITGSGLAGEITLIRLGERDVAVPAADAQSEQVLSAVPANMRPGVTNLQVLHEWNKPEGEIDPPASGTVPAERSNLLPMAIRPVLVSGGEVTLSNRTENDGVVSWTATINFTPDVGALQQIELHLLARVADGNGRFPSFVFEGDKPAPGTQDVAVSQRTVTITGVPAGDYLLRVRVDGAESALESDATGYSGPLLTVPA
jgi:hypothetical protein